MTRKNDDPKKRRRKARALRMRLINVRNDNERRMRLYAEADKRAVLGEYRLAAGTWKHPRTGLWQVWISTTGSDISWISVHRSPARAQQDVAELQAAGARGDLYDVDKVVALIERLARAGDGEPENVSAEDIANITSYIAKMAAENDKEEHHP